MKDSHIRIADLGSGSRTLRVAGLMSGTSADGVDVAIVEISRRRLKVLAFQTVSYPSALREAVLSGCDPETSRVDDICRLNFALGEFFAEAVERVCRRGGIDVSSLDLIGSHGQTIHHLPDAPKREFRTTGSTLQIAEPSIIAQRTGVTTVADFRPRDMAAGGQGAPLVPYADAVLFGNRRNSRAIQNIGGIANVTYLPGSGDDVDAPFQGYPIAFDTGPGNMIMDRLAATISNGRLSYDKGGRLAGAGRVSRPLLAELMRHPFLKRRPPRTTGREEFGAGFADALLRRAARLDLSPRDAMATAAAFTTRTIVAAYRKFLPPVDEVILCGGGARNPVLVEMLRHELGGARVMLMDELGVNGDAREAIAFAILAYQTLHNRPSNVPAATGAKEQVVLGKIVPGRNWGRIKSSVVRGS